MDNYNNFNNNFNGNDYPRRERVGMAMSSLLVGIMSLPFAYCTGIFGILLGLVAILLGIFSKGTAPMRSGKAVAGIITGAVGITLGIIMVVIAFYMMTANPDILSQYQEILDFYNKR